MDLLRDWLLLLLEGSVSAAYKNTANFVYPVVTISLYTLIGITVKDHNIIESNVH